MQIYKKHSPSKKRDRGLLRVVVEVILVQFNLLHISNVLFRKDLKWPTKLKSPHELVKILMCSSLLISTFEKYNLFRIFYMTVFLCLQ